MNPSSRDVQHLARALDALTTQVRRLADTQTTGVAPADDTQTTTARRPVVSVHGARNMSPEAREAVGALVDVAKRQITEAPAADEDAQRTNRRDSTRNLIDRLTHNGVLSSGETALLRQHVEAETREHDTARAVAAGNKRHVQTIVPEIDRLAAELEDAETRADGFRAERDQAQAAIERVRAILGPLKDQGATGRTYHQAITDALDGTEQPTTETA